MAKVGARTFRPLQRNSPSLKVNCWFCLGAVDTLGIYSSLDFETARLEGIVPNHKQNAPSAATTSERSPALSAAQRGLFRKEGEYWTLGLGASSFRLKDTKGLAYIAHLLRHPGTEFHALDLAGGIAGRDGDEDSNQQIAGLPRGEEDLEKAGIHIASLGDAGELLDEQAKSAYRRRISELREELDEAKAHGNAQSGERIEAEIDALTAELSRAVGLGGRNRRAASASERARQSITKAIKTVLEKILQDDADFGGVLSQCIKTGTFCSYQPDPDFPIAWEFAATHIEAGRQPFVDRKQESARPDSSGFAPPALVAAPFSLAERTAFVGRQPERDAIGTAIDRAIRGHGSLVMLAGGPGVGKTRLAIEMADYAYSLNGFRVLVGHSYERDDPVPFLPFIEIIESSLAQAASLHDYRLQIADNAAELAQLAPSLRRVFPDIPEPMELPPAQRRRYIFQSFSEALARWARISPQFLVVDDLQWADESTLALLIHLANRVSQLPVVIIGTYRDDYSNANGALVRTLEELIRHGIRPIKLAGLSRDGVAEMLDRLSRRRAPENLVGAVFEESQGNPFFVEEVFRHLLDEGRVFDANGDFRGDIKIDEIDVPENIRLIIGRRLNRFDEDEKKIVSAAAVIGRSFSFQSLAAISQIDVDELFTVIEKAQQLGMIVPSSEGPETPFRFAHELVRQTLLAGILAPRRQRLHAAVAGALEKLHPGALREHAGEIAHHLLKAGTFADRRALGQWLMRAGEVALEAAGFEEARANFEAALSLQGSFGDRERADRLASLAIAERGVQRWDWAIAHFRESLDLYIRMNDREMCGKSFNELTDTFVQAGRHRDAIETGRRGLNYLQKDITGDRVRLLGALGHAYAACGEYEPAQEALREMLDLATRIGDPKLEARVISARSILDFHFFRLREATEDGLRSEHGGGAEAAPWQRGFQLRILCQSLVYVSRPGEALRIADVLEPLAARIDQTYTLELCKALRAIVEFGNSMDLARLEAGFQSALMPGQKPAFPFLLAMSEVNLSLLNFFRGDWSSALRHAQASCGNWGSLADLSGPEARTSIDGFGAGVVFRQMAYLGERAGASKILEENRKLLPVSGQPNVRGSWLLLALVVEGLAMMGERQAASELYPLTRELVDTGAVMLWPISRFSQTIAGIAASAAHRYEAATEHFQLAIRQAQEFPYLLEPTEIRRFQAMMLTSRDAPGDRDKARKLLADACASYKKIGMPRHVEMTQALLDKV
jgi:predicted ATPase